MSATSLTIFFGDAEHRFDFDATLIGELEKKTDAGIGGLFKRLVDRSFRYADLMAVLRLGLVGGGARPEEADRLVKVYGEGRAIEETYPVAVAVLSALWFGNAEEPAPAPVAQPEPVPSPVVVPVSEPVVAPLAPAPIVPAPQGAPVPLAWNAPFPGLIGDIGSEV